MDVISLLVWIVIIFALAWCAYYVITTFFPEPVRTPALLLVGVVLLIIILMALMKGLPSGGLRVP